MTSLGLTNPDGAKATIKTGKGDAHVGENRPSGSHCLY